MKKPFNKIMILADESNTGCVAAATDRLTAKIAKWQEEMEKEHEQFKCSDKPILNMTFSEVKEEKNPRFAISIAIPYRVLQIR